MDFQGPLFDVRMRRGQGYNSYIQEPRVENAVEFRPRSANLHQNPLADATAKAADGVATTAETSKDTSEDTITTKTTTSANGKAIGPGVGQPPQNWNDFFPALLQYMSNNEASAAKSQNTKILPYLKPSPSGKANQTVLFSSKQVKSTSEIDRAMGFKASAAVKAGSIGPGAEAGTNLASSRDFNANTLNFLVHVRVVNERSDNDEIWDFNPVVGLTQRLKGITCADCEDEKSTAQGEVENPCPGCIHKRAIEFTRIYGDTFISDFVEGGEIYALVGIRSRNTANMNELRVYASAQLTPAAIPIQVKTDVDFNKKGREAFEQAETSIRVQWRGGGEIKNHDFQWGLDSLIQIANAFPSFVASASAKIRAVLTPYSAVKAFQKFQLSFPQAPLTLSYDHCALFVDTLYEDYKSFHSMWEELNDMISSPGNYKANVKKNTRKEPDKPQQRNQAERLRMSKEFVGNDSAAAADPSQFTETAFTLSSQRQETPALMSRDKRSSTAPLPKRFGITPVPEITPNVTIQARTSNILLTDLQGILNEDDDPKLEPLDPTNAQQLSRLRLLCRSAMLHIQEIAAELVIDPQKSQVTSEMDRDGIPRFVQPLYPYPGTLRSLLPVMSQTRTVGLQYDPIYYQWLDDIKIPASMQMDGHINDYAYDWHVCGDTLSRYKEYEHFHIGDFTLGKTQYPHAIAFQKTNSGILQYVNRKARDDVNMISGIAFRYNDAPQADFIDLQNRVLDDGKTKSAKSQSRLQYEVCVGQAPTSEADWTITADLSDVNPIATVNPVYKVGSGRICGLTLLKAGGDDEGSSENIIISHKSWEGRGAGKQPDPSPISPYLTFEPNNGSSPAERYWMFAGFMGAFEKVGPLKRDRALAKLAVIWKRRPEDMTEEE
jgi:hypothetical protein